MKSDRLQRALTAFQQLSYQDQLDRVWQEGILLHARRLPGFWLHLYAIDTFFVEMWVCQRRFDVALLQSFRNTDELEPYLEKISLPTVLPDW